ncbi:hypothetical protein Tco_0022444, partial [Tanacetum coccineum]
PNDADHSKDERSADSDDGLPRLEPTGVFAMRKAMAFKMK